MEVHTFRTAKSRNGLVLIFADKEGNETELKFSVSRARDLMKMLFRLISPDWGGEREGAGKRKED